MPIEAIEKIEPHRLNTVAEAKALVIKPVENDEPYYIKDVGAYYAWVEGSTALDSISNIQLTNFPAAGRLVAITPRYSPVSTVTGNYTLQATDADSIIVVDSPAPVTITTSGLGSGQSCIIIQKGLGQFEVVSGSLVAFSGPAWYKSDGAGSVVQIVVAGNVAYIEGGLVA